MKTNIDKIIIDSKLELSFLSISNFLKYDDLFLAKAEANKLIEDLSDYIFNNDDWIIFDLFDGYISRYKLTEDLKRYIKREVEFRLIN